MRKKGRKGKLLPSLIDDSRVSPKVPSKLQFSSDFARVGGKKGGKIGATDMGGYATEGGADHTRFNSTYDEGFNQG